MEETVAIFGLQGRIRNSRMDSPVAGNTIFLIKPRIRNKLIDAYDTFCLILTVL